MALVLDEDGYITVTRKTGSTIDRLAKPEPVNKEIAEFSTPFETLTLQETPKVKKSDYEMQEAATDIGVEQIMECIAEEYVEELNKDYFRFANSSTSTILAHL